MSNTRDRLLELLLNRKDLEVLSILKENPELCDNTVARLALDNRCFKTITYLRDLDVITLDGRQEREEARLNDLNNQLELLENLTKEVDDYVHGIRRE